jgi:predicted O-methyltransferase YrrM
MRTFRHWTPAYLANRIRWEAYQRRHPHDPWITPAAIALLKTLLRPSDAGIEFGSGRSTHWFGERLGHLTSVEHVPAWFAIVSKQLEAAKVRNISYHLLSIEPVDDPVRSPYVRVVDGIADESLGFALIDGGYREQTAHAALRKLEAGGLLVVDNANWYLDHPSPSPYSRTGKGDLNHFWVGFRKRVADWRLVWTSCGCSDTAIWVKPARWVDPDPGADQAGAG